MKIALVTLEDFNEIDTFVACTLLNRIQRPDWEVSITCPTATVTSMNGVKIHAQQLLEALPSADAVLFGSGRRSRQQSQDPDLLAQFRLDPERQLIGSQCSGTLMLAALGLLDHQPVCTDVKTRPLLEAQGFEVLPKAFHAQGNLATAGGCLAAVYLASWVIQRCLGTDRMAEALKQVAPVGEETAWLEAVERVLS